MGAPNSVIHLSRQLNSLLQNSSSWHLVITTLHLCWKSCTGFPFQSALNTKLHACASMLQMDPVLLTSELLHIYTSSHTLRSSSDSRILKIQQYKRKTHGFRTFTFFFLYPMFGIHSHKTSGNAQLLHLSRRTWKLSFFHSISVPVNFSSHFSY